jgi:hypothetical protein
MILIISVIVLLYVLVKQENSKFTSVPRRDLKTL